MNKSEFVRLFDLAFQGDEDAAQEVEQYLSEQIVQVQQGSNAAREKLEELVYAVTYQWVERRMNPLLRKQGHSVGTPVNEAWCKILSKQEILPLGETNGFRGLCLRVGRLVRYTLLDVINEQREWDERHRSIEGDESGDGLAELAVSSEPTPEKLLQWQEYGEKVEKLPKDEQEVWDLYYHMDMSLERISEILGITVYKVKQLLAKAKIRLRDTDFLD